MTNDSTRNQLWIVGIMIALALTFGVGLCTGTILKVDRAVASVSTQYEVQIEELRATLGATILSQDREIAELQELYGKLRRDLYDKWAADIPRRVRIGGTSGGMD